MANVHLLDNNTLGWEPVDVVDAQIVGNAGHATADGFVNRLRWRRHTAGTGSAPSRLSLWNVATGAELAHATPADDGTVAWQDTLLVPSVPVTAGQTLIVSAIWPSGSRRSQGGSSGQGTPPSPLAFDSGPLRYTLNSSAVAMPASVGSGYVNGVDFAYDATAESPGGTGDPTLTGDLESWLTNTNANQHKTDGIPWQLKLAHEALSSGLGSAITGLYKRLDDGVAWLRSHLDALPDSIQAMVDAELATLEDRFTAVNNAIAYVQALVDAASQVQSGNNGSALGALSGRTGFPTTGWTMVDETDFDTDLAWAVPADLYVLTVTTLPPGVASDDFAGAEWLHRLGSWAPLDGSQIAGQRGFVEFSPQQLHQFGWRMPGLALRCKPATLGHVQAWTLA